MSEGAAGCGWCGEPALNCPNDAGECCCLPCYENGPVAAHPTTTPPPNLSTTEGES